jgi:hypothetical protein
MSDNRSARGRGVPSAGIDWSGYFPANPKSAGTTFRFVEINHDAVVAQPGAKSGP